MYFYMSEFSTLHQSLIQPANFCMNLCWVVITVILHGLWFALLFHSVLMVSNEGQGGCDYEYSLTYLEIVVHFQFFMSYDGTVCVYHIAMMHPGCPISFCATTIWCHLYDYQSQ